MNAAYEVLDSLHARLPPEQRAAAVSRILRVPAAWQQLHDPEYLAKFRAADLSADLTPSHLASLALGGPLATPLGPHLAGERSNESGQAWEAFAAAPKPVNDLKTLALLALEVTLLEDWQASLRIATADPASWRDVLAVAWQGHPEREDMLPALLRNGEEAGLGLAVHIALTNLNPVDAVQPLLSAYPSPAHDLVRYLRDHGEAAFASIVLQSLTKGVSPTDPAPHGRLLDSEHSMAQGDAKAAWEALQAAWEVASSTAASIADRMAAWAAEHADPVLALEASRRALENQPTPERRADHALSLLGLGRVHEAFTGLPSDSAALEEQIAMGKVLSEHGQAAEADRALDQAIQGLAAGGLVKDRWLRELMQTLASRQRMDAAVQVASLRSQRAPASSEARHELIRLLEETGDPTAAAQQARLAVGLQPDSIHGRMALAKNLADAGQAAAALPLWEGLVKDGAASLLDLGRCALAAGDIPRAEEIATSLLQQGSEIPQASTLLAHCLISRGDAAGAEARLREVVRDHPDCIEARLALAEALASSGQESAAGEVQFAAVQAMPHEPAPAIALSRWLRDQGRPSEATEVAKSGLAGHPDHVGLLIESGEASLQIGAHELALNAFERASRHQPGNWRAWLGLARAFEQTGDAVAGRACMRELPETAPANAFVDAARITILAAEAESDPHAVRTAKNYLQQAAQKSPDDPSIALWSARGHEVAGRAQDALVGYQHCLARFASEDADSYAAALLGIGRTAIASGELPLALSTLEQAQKRFPVSGEIQCLLSEAYGAANLPEKAVKAAEQAIEIDGRNPQAWSTLGRARAAVGDLDGAIQAYQGLSSILPAEPQGWMELAGLAQHAEAPQVMRKALSEALRRGRRSAPVLIQAADILEETGAMGSALRMLRSAAKANPEDHAVLARLGKLGEDAGDLNTAHAAWSRLGVLDPQNAKAFQRSAEALWGLRRSRQAIRDWHRALELDPQNAGIHRALGKAYLQLGEVQHGLNQYSAAIQSRPDDPELALEAGVLAMRSGAHLEAGGLLSAAVEGDPTSAEAWAALGECRALLAQWAEAENALSRAHDLGAASTRMPALRVLASLAMGDLASAAAWLDQAGRIPPEIAQDAVWLARAELRMGDWSGAIQALETWLRGSQDPVAEQALREIRFAVAEARWIHEQAGAEASDAALIHDWREVPAEAEADRLRAALLMDSVSQEALEGLQAAMHGSHGSAAGQSLVIGWLRAGQPQAALRDLGHARPPAYGFDWRPLLQGIALRQLGRMGEALDALEVGAQDPVLRPLSEAMQADLRAELGDGEAAIEAWNRALGARPGEAGWHHALAVQYLEQGALDAGLPHLQQAVELAPGNMGYRMQLAKTLAACGHSAEAVATFQLAIQRSKPTLEELLLAGEAALDAQAADQAADWFEKAQASASHDPRGLVGAARAAMARGKVRKARESIDAAMRAAPHDPRVLLGHGEILAMQRDFRGALQAFEQVRGASGDLKSRLITAKSAALMALGQVDQAERSLLQELERAPEDPNLWFPLATVQEAKGDLTTAAEAASQAVRLAPLNPDYRLALARICRGSGNLDRALDELARARELAPGDPRVSLEQGLVYEDRRDYRRALEAYRRAIELDKRCTQAYYRSGLVLKQLKSYPQAGQMLKRAAELAPVDRDVMHQLAAVRALELVHGPSAGVLQ